MKEEMNVLAARLLFKPGADRLYNIIIPHELLLGVFSDFYETNERNLLPVIYGSDDRVLEFGTGIGCITAILGMQCEFVLGLEAMPRYAEVAEFNIQANNLSNVVVLPMMGYTSNGEMSYHVRNFFYSSSAVPDRPGMEKDTIEMITVPTVDVNGLIDEYNINAIHLDVEGSERELIPHILSSPHIANIHIISLETHTHILGVEGNRKLFYSLMDAGFEPVALSGLYQFPAKSYAISFARPPLADELRHRRYLGDCGATDMTDFKRALG